MSTAPPLAAGFGIRLGGRELPPELEAAVLSVRVEDELNVPTMFALRLNTTNFATGSWRGLDLDTFAPGGEVQVAMGARRAQVMTVGEITSLEPSFGSYSTMEIRGHDRLYRLNFGLHTRTFLRRRDSEIAAQLARDVGLRPSAQASPVVNPFVLQNNQSNYEFLRERAARLDYEMWADDRAFHFAPARTGQPPVARLRYGVDVGELDLRLHVLTRGSKVVVTAWNAATKKVTRGTAASAPRRYRMGGKGTGQQFAPRFLPSPVLHPELDVADARAAARVAEAQYALALDGFVEGEAQVGGRPDLRAGVNVQIDGLGRRFSGLYYVTASVHSFDLEEGYRTSLSLRRTGI